MTNEGTKINRSTLASNGLTHSHIFVPFYFNKVKGVIKDETTRF